MANFLAAVTFATLGPRKISEGSRAGNRTYPSEVMTPEIGKLPQNCGKHLHTSDLEAKPTFGSFK